MFLRRDGLLQYGMPCKTGSLVEYVFQGVNSSEGRKELAIYFNSDISLSGELALITKTDETLLYR